MIIYPAMDLMNGRVVRLRQGRFDEATAYDTSPVHALRRFAQSGASWAHVVDLDGARLGRPEQHDLIADLASTSPLRLQVAGGFRERDQLARMFDAGAERIVIGSLAVKEPETVRSWMEEFGPERLVLSLDVRIEGGDPLVATHGWAEDSGMSLWTIARIYPEMRHLLVTDIGRDGLLNGPNVALYQEIGRQLPDARVQASGGISSIADLEQLPTSGAVIGKALWEGLIELREAIRLADA